MKESAKFNIEGLSSLKCSELRSKKAEVDFSIRNLPSLTTFNLTISATIDDVFVTRLLDQIQHIQELSLDGNLSYFKLDNLLNLKKLSLNGTINDSFNFELFNSLCNQLEDISICLRNMKENSYVKLFDGYTFPYLQKLTLRRMNITILEKEFFDRLPMLRELEISDCKIEAIESDTFSNLEQLRFLDLSANRIDSIEKDAFSTLKNLQKLNLNLNTLENFDPNFVGLVGSAKFRI